MKEMITFFGDINEETGVIMAFTKIHKELGFPKLVPSSSRGFDIDNILYNGRYVTVEFEYLSDNFIKHGHVKNMVEGRDYVVICWEDNCKLLQKVPNLYEVIELKNKIKIKKDFMESSANNDEIKYMILSYNPDNAEKKDFSDWKFSNCYRCNSKFSKDYIPAGSKVLFARNGYLIGGFTVVRYEKINEPKNDNEWLLYKKLTDYPMTLYTRSIEELKSSFTSGHIFYTDFFEIENIKLEWKNFIKDKKMSHDGRIYITKEQYYNIVGT